MCKLSHLSLRVDKDDNEIRKRHVVEAFYQSIHVLRIHTSAGVKRKKIAQNVVVESPAGMRKSRIIHLTFTDASRRRDFDITRVSMREKPFANWNGLPLG